MRALSTVAGEKRRTGGASSARRKAVTPRNSLSIASGKRTYPVKHSRKRLSRFSSCFLLPPLPVAPSLLPRLLPPQMLAMLLLVMLSSLACRSPVPLNHAPSSPSSDSALSAPRLSSTSTARTVRTLPLVGPLASAHAEVSGLAWYGSELILLPQHPYRMSGRATHGLLFALSHEAIKAFLSGRRKKPLRPRPITLLAPHLKERSPLYEGFEALAFRGARAYLATEAVADVETGTMHGYLFSGPLRNDTLRLGTQHPVLLPSQTQMRNMAYEALLAFPERIVALHEAYGRNINNRPQALVFSPDLQLLHTLAFPSLEYRLTDATAPDARGRFWVMNYFFPGERKKLMPAPDPLASTHGTAGDPAEAVERLVEYQLKKGSFQRTQAPPLPLALLPAQPRNWEGLVRFPRDGQIPDDGQPSGFLLVTDQYPGTVLGFVAAPGRP